MSKSSKHFRTSLNYFATALSITIIVLLFTTETFFELKTLRRAELSLIDYRFQKRGVNSSIKDSAKIVIVEISKESFKSLPDKWPWPRTYFSRLVRNLKLAGAKAIGIDIVFSTGDNKDARNDEDFKKALKEVGNVVLAGQLIGEQQHYTLVDSTENYGNFYIGEESRFGLVNVRGDEDGILRRYMPFGVDPSREKRIPTFSIAVLNVYFQQSALYTPTISDNYFQYLERSIPRYDQISFLVNYYGPSGTFNKLKFEDIIDDVNFSTVEEESLNTEVNTFDDPDIGYLNSGILKDKIVLIGSTMPEDKDLFFVPLGQGRQEGDNQMYGVEIHANVIQSIIDNNFIKRQPFWLNFVIVFLLSCFTIVMVSGLKSIKVHFTSIIEILGVLTVLAELLLVFWGAVQLFVNNNYLADMMSPLLAIALSYVGGTVYNYVSERKQKLMIKNMFSHYVNKDVVNELIKNPDKLHLLGERREMTVMFTDIENFTALAEKMKAEQLVTILNEYLNEMTSIIFRNSGTIDKYEGDAIMAFWGAPLPCEDHAILACRTAVDMKKALVSIRKKWVEAGRQPLNVRIGINTGEMIVGNIGGSGKFEYTVIGDSVNLGARLESANKQYRTNIMISEATYNKACKHILARELDMIIVAGKTYPIRVYELIDLLDDKISSELLDFITYYNNGLKLYRNREWKEAIKEFEKALEIFPNDYPSQIYIERSHLYNASPPPEDWNGVFVLLTK